MSETAVPRRLTASALSILQEAIAELTRMLAETPTAHRAQREALAAEITRLARRLSWARYLDSKKEQP